MGSVLSSPACETRLHSEGFSARGSQREAGSRGLEEVGWETKGEVGAEGKRRICRSLRGAWAPAPARLPDPVLAFTNALILPFGRQPLAYMFLSHFLFIYFFASLPPQGWSSRTSSTSGPVTSFLLSPLNTSWTGHRKSSSKSRSRHIACPSLRAHGRSSALSSMSACARQSMDDCSQLPGGRKPCIFYL